MQGVAKEVLFEHSEDAFDDIASRCVPKIEEFLLVLWPDMY
jgi:hypothetical protein